MQDTARERIETKLAFLERANSELSDALFRQQRIIDELRIQVATLWTRMQAWREPGATPGTPEDERPPHY